VQHSAAYNLIRNTAYHTWRRHVVQSESAESRARKAAFYNELFSAFADDLQRRGIRLVMFDVPHHLSRWPGVLSHVQALQRRGLVHLLDTADWFSGMRNYGTPEGHPWGPLGHRVVAEHLAPELRAALAVPVAATH
jgi:hypothetical protein